MVLFKKIMLYVATKRKQKNLEQSKAKLIIYDLSLWIMEVGATSQTSSFFRFS